MSQEAGEQNHQSEHHNFGDIHKRREKGENRLRLNALIFVGKGE